jgi:hypothetical protein
LQKLFESVELRLPEDAVLRNPCGGAFHGVGVETAAMNAAIDFAAQQASGFKNAKMFGDGGERHLKRLGEFGDFGLALREASEDGAASGIGESAEGGVEGGIGMVNHMV